MKFIKVLFGLIQKLRGWILADEIQPLSFSELKPLTLKGNFDLGYTLGKYSEKKRTKIGKLVYHFKYRKNKKAGDILVDLSTQFIKENYPDFELVIPVPPAVSSQHFFSYRFFSRNLTDNLQKPLTDKVIQRIKLAQPQKDFVNLEGKRENIKDSLKISQPQKVKDKTVLIIDDIYDSGTTVNEISSLLKSALAHKVFVFTIAKTGFYD